MTTPHDIIRAWCASMGMPAPSNGDVAALLALLLPSAPNKLFFEEQPDGVITQVEPDPVCLGCEDGAALNKYGQHSYPNGARFFCTTPSGNGSPA